MFEFKTFIYEKTLYSIYEYSVLILYWIMTKKRDKTP